MKKIIKNWQRILLSAACGLIIWGISRALIFKIVFPVGDPLDMKTFNDSFFVERGLFIPALIIFGIIYLTLFSATFAVIEEKLFGNKLTKSLIFSTGYLLLYMSAFLEFYYFYNGSIKDAVLAGLADGIPVFLTGIIAGLLLSTDKSIKFLRPKENLISIITITIFFTAGRNIFYRFVYPDRLIDAPFSSVYFILLGGASGILYYFLSQGINSNRPLIKAAGFSLIFGAVWIPFNLFPCLQVQMPVKLEVCLNFLDLTAIMMGGWIGETVSRNANIKRIQKKRTM